MPREVWDEMTYQFLNFNGSTVEVWEWISNLIPHFIMDVITYLKLTYVNKWAPRWVASLHRGPIIQIIVSWDFIITITMKNVGNSKPVLFQTFCIIKEPLAEQRYISPWQSVTVSSFLDLAEANSISSSPIRHPQALLLHYASRHLEWRSLR